MGELVPMGPQAGSRSDAEGVGGGEERLGWSQIVGSGWLTVCDTYRVTTPSASWLGGAQRAM